MKIKIKQTCLVGVVALLSVLLVAPNSFADETPYYEGMLYEGGDSLSSENVTINENLVNSLSTLVKMSDSEAEYEYIDTTEPGRRWQQGFVKVKGVCRPATYFTLHSDLHDGMSLSFKVSENQYTVITEFEEVALRYTPEKRLAIGVIPHNGVVFYGQKVYEDSACRTLNEDIENTEGTTQKGAFFKLKIKLFANGETVISDGLYFGLTDIDAAQSYRILNEGNQLSKDNMFAKNASDLQSEDPNDFRNMFVENAFGNYIYSEHDNDSDRLILDGGNDIYVKLNKTTQEDGLEMVWGFKGWAWSGIEYYAKQFEVKYVSEENGAITGKTEENVMSGGHPSGRTVTPNENYEFDYWTANVDVTVDYGGMGTIIKAGEKITDEQLKNVLVNQDITFTAVYKAKQFEVNYESGENGKITGDTEEDVMPGGNPTGSTVTPNENYEFDYWKADVDVTLKDGTEIKAGEKITDKQLKQVIVDQDITFTAVYKKVTPKTPDTGLFTSSEKGMVVVVSAVTITIISTVIYLSRYAIKRQKAKVNFGKK